MANRTQDLIELLDKTTGLELFMSSSYFKFFLELFDLAPPHQNYYDSNETYLYALKCFYKKDYENVVSVVDRAYMDYESTYKNFNDLFELRAMSYLKMALIDQEHIARNKEEGDDGD